MNAAPSTPFACRELAPFGVEIDLDPDRELTPDEQRAFHDLVYRHHLVLVRGRRFSMQAHARLLSYLGPVLPAEVDSRYVALDGAFADQAMAFHSDFAFTEQPIDVISLHAVDVVDGETSTLFASGARAYRNLPPALRAQADSLRQVAAMRPKPSDVPIEAILPGGLPKVTRDIVMKHPVTGESILYVTEQASDSIEGLPSAESDALLSQFAAQIFAPDNLYEHRWHAGDLVIWDNLALQHGRRELTGVRRRTLQRVCVARRSFYDLCPQFFVADPRLLKWLAEGDPNVGRWARI